MNRRGFLKGMAGILASGIAPAAIGSGILMPVRNLIGSSWIGVDFGLEPATVVITLDQTRHGMKTDFGALTDEQKKLWSRALWRAYRPGGISVVDLVELAKWQS